MLIAHHDTMTAKPGAGMLRCGHRSLLKCQSPIIQHPDYGKDSRGILTEAQ